MECWRHLTLSVPAETHPVPVSRGKITEGTAGQRALATWLSDTVVLLHLYLSDTVVFLHLQLLLCMDPQGHLWQEQDLSSHLKNGCYKVETVWTTNEDKLELRHEIVLRRSIKYQIGVHEHKTSWDPLLE